MSTATKSGILNGLEICGQGKKAKMHVDTISKGNLAREIDPKMMGGQRGRPGGAEVAQNSENRKGLALRPQGNK